MTYDEFGGQWDHVSPPGTGAHGRRARRLGAGHPDPGAGDLGGRSSTSGVDHTVYDTTSIMATIEHSFGLHRWRAGTRR